MTQITDNSQQTNPHTHLLPLLYQHLNTQLMELTQHNRQLQDEIRDNSDQYYEQLIKIQKQLYARLEERDKQHRILENQLEEWMCRYNKLENMEEVYGNQVENSMYCRLRKQDELKDEGIRCMAYRARQEQREPEFQAELQRYRQNNIKYKYLEQKNKQLEKLLSIQKQQLKQIANIQQQNPAKPKYKPKHKHKPTHTTQSINTNTNTNTTTKRTSNIIPTTSLANNKKQPIVADIPLSCIAYSNINSSVVSKQGRYTISTVSESRDLCRNGVGEQLTSINQFNI